MCSRRERAPFVGLLRLLHFLATVFVTKICMQDEGSTYTEGIKKSPGVA